jgi:hypothetical protein
MRELKDIRSVRALRAEKHQPKPQLHTADDDSVEAKEPNEAVVVELPSRKVRSDEAEAESPTSATKSRKRGGRQKTTSTAKPKQSTATNRSWEVSPKAEDEETVVNAPNRTKAIEGVIPPIPTEVKVTEPMLRPDVVTRSPHPYSARLAKPLQSLRVEQTWDVSQPLAAQDLQQMQSQMQSQMQHINQLSTELQQEIVELKALANKINRDNQDLSPAKAKIPPQDPLDLQAGHPSSFMPQTRQPATPAPVEGHSADFLRAEQEAAVNAQTLRYLANRERMAAPGAELPLNIRERRSPVRRRNLKYYMYQLQKFLQLPQDFSGLLIDTGVWVLSSAAIGFGLKLLMTQFPVLLIPLTLLKVVPAILAAYLALFVPKAGAISGYRLFLVMLGFWLGSKLG